MKRFVSRWLPALGFSLLIGGSLTASAQEPGQNPEDLFKRLDKNGDGVLKSDEIGAEQQRFFERLLRVGDKDGNKELTREEFLAGVRPEERPAAGDRPAGDRPAGGERPDGRRIFERFDANKDGKLTRDEIPEEFRNRVVPVFERLGKAEITQEEFTRAMAQFADRRPGEGGGRPDPARFDEMFRRFDANGDGKVTLDEAPEPARRMLEGVFQRLNRDGKEGLSKEELQRALAGGPGRPGEGRPAEGRPGENRPPEGRPAEGRPGEGQAPRGSLPRFFRIADANGDGRITKEELSRFSEKFAELDENKDGELDPRELLGAPPGGRPEDERRPGGERRTEGQNRPEGQSRPEAPNRPESQNRPEGQRRPEAGRGGEFLDEVFRRQDKNSDGKISKDEAENRIRENFDQLDADKDGLVTREELVRGMARRAQEGRPEGRPERRRPERNSTPDSNPSQEKKPE